MTPPPTENDIRERTQGVLDDHAGLEGPLLPILHGLQEEFGYLPADALRIVADRLNISRAEVHGVASFYHDFREQPAGRHVVKICRAEACQSMGGDAIAEHAEGRFKIGFGETAPDGSVTLEAVYCLGLCACAPAAMVDGKVVGRLDEARIDAIAEEVRA
ncbi:formate dehydrogenase subunit gamma [Oricola nitratireducens]|jgi:formate dehydrogenase subunit gamma|uniref:formate dehydrogenase subunit gamma n=1 Tax=Oricola nitratireducens TaxID=2775868 RepID=UPI00186745E1|nr:formate dehydrogenase subunit gamma [Oricola nitratireducens]